MKKYIIKILICFCFNYGFGQIQDLSLQGASISGIQPISSCNNVRLTLEVHNADGFNNYNNKLHESEIIISIPPVMDIISGNFSVSSHSGTNYWSSSIKDESNSELKVILKPEAQISPGDIIVITYDNVSLKDDKQYQTYDIVFQINHVIDDTNGSNDEKILSLSTQQEENCDATPVELEWFEATKFENAVQLSWTTQSEENSDYFQVEHSTDGVEFTSLGRINGAGNAFQRNAYELLHNDPDMGFNYYRLKMVDLDGSFEYSNIKIVEFMEMNLNEELQVVPNPTNSYLRVIAGVNFNTCHDCSVEIINSLGETMLTTVFVNQQLMDVSFLNSGVYTLMVKHSKRNAVEYTKFVKTD